MRLLASSFGLFRFRSFPVLVFNMPSNAAVDAASAAFRALVLTVYGILIVKGAEQSTLESFGAIVGNLITKFGQDSNLVKQAAAKYALIAQAWTVICNARAAAAVAAVAAASAAFRDAVQEVYGDEVAAGQEQLTLDSRVAKVGSIIKEFGLNSDAFKEAAEKYELIVPAWTAFFNARKAAE